MRKSMKNKGFTLVELIVVIVILAILAAILVPAAASDVYKRQGYIEGEKLSYSCTDRVSKSLCEGNTFTELYKKLRYRNK